MHHLKGILAAGMVMLLAFGTACGSDDSTGPGDALVGQWVANTWEYTNTANTSEKVDVVADLGATVTLTFTSADTYTVRFEAPGAATQTISGTFTVSGSSIIIVETGQTEADTLAFSLTNNGETLSFTSNAADWDFDDDGTDDPATLSAVFDKQ